MQPQTTGQTGPNGKPLGTTQYYSRNVNGETQYQTLPSAGNDPYGFTNISKDQYVSGLQGKVQAAQQPGYMGTSDIANWQKQIADIQAGSGVNAQGYVDPSFSKFQANAPTPSQQYFTPEAAAQYNKDFDTYTQQKTAAANNPALQTASTPQEQLADKYNQILQQTQASGQTAPNSQGAANAAISGATPPPPPPGPNTGLVNTTLQGDQGLQGIMQNFQQMFSTQNQQQSLAQEYQQMMAQSGLPALNTQLMSMKNVMQGTEDDIRNEVTKAGGFATNSQVLALTDARNKVMVQQYNNLLDQQKMLTDQVNTMIGLAGQDRQFAQQQLMNQFNIQSKLVDMQQSMQKNATDSMQNNIKNFGAKAVYDAAVASGDPTAIQRINSMMGPGFDLKTMSEAKTPMSELDKANLAHINAETAKIYSDINQSNNSGTTLANANQRTTTSGITYIDGTNLTGKDATAAQQAAAKAGIPYLDKTSADLQNNVETARQNMTNISSSLDGLLAKNGLDVGTKLSNVFSSATQIGKNADALASFGAYRSAAIQALRAMAGAKGLRINKDEILQSVNNDIPKITDTVGVAKNKIAIVNSLLDSQEKGTFGSQNYKPTTGQSTNAPKLLTPTDIPSGYYQASDGLLYKK